MYVFSLVVVFLLSLYQVGALVNMCKNGETIFNDTTYVTYSSTGAELFKECRCFVDSGTFSLTVLDLRLAYDPGDPCSSATIFIAHNKFACNAENGDIRPVSGRQMIASAKDAYFSVVLSSKSIIPESLLVSITPRVSAKLTCIVKDPVKDSERHQDHLTVSAGDNKVLQLPDEHEISLNAFVMQDENNDTAYHYNWTVEAYPENANIGTMEGKNTSTIKLSHLVAGLYTFRVQVTGKKQFGVAFVCVTVKPELSTNNSTGLYIVICMLILAVVVVIVLAFVCTERIQRGKKWFLDQIGSMQLCCYSNQSEATELSLKRENSSKNRGYPNLLQPRKRDLGDDENPYEAQANAHDLDTVATELLPPPDLPITLES